MSRGWNWEILQKITVTVCNILGCHFSPKEWDTIRLRIGMLLDRLFVYHVSCFVAGFILRDPIHCAGNWLNISNIRLSLSACAKTSRILWILPIWAFWALLRSNILSYLSDLQLSRRWFVKVNREQRTKICLDTDAKIYQAQDYLHHHESNQISSPSSTWQSWHWMPIFLTL